MWDKCLNILLMRKPTTKRDDAILAEIKLIREDIQAVKQSQHDLRLSVEGNLPAGIKGLAHRTQVNEDNLEKFKDGIDDLMDEVRSLTATTKEAVIDLAKAKSDLQEIKTEGFGNKRFVAGVIAAVGVLSATLTYAADKWLADRIQTSPSKMEKKVDHVTSS